ncbi:PilN domain-containing protein [candidate division WOR-3 bacterium]|nr:PilN domain-containing protein [candidate division WOR-3 bacterium]
MIKINLVPEEQRKKVREVKFKKPSLRIPKFDMIFSILLLGAAIAGVFFLNFQKDLKLKKLDSDIADAQQQLKELEKERKMVEDIERQQAELKEWVTLVQSLNEGRALYFHVMDELNKLKPEYMWLTLFEETNQNFKLNGKTFSNYMISNLMDNLNASPYFKDVKLDEIKETEEKEHSVIGFQLSGSILGGKN